MVCHNFFVSVSNIFVCSCVVSAQTAKAWIYQCSVGDDIWHIYVYIWHIYVYIWHTYGTYMCTYGTYMCTYGTHMAHICVFVCSCVVSLISSK